jgi:hypothetical protein
MSLLAVQGGATGTGTVTLLAPVTNTDRTLTLPDVTDTVAGIAATQTLTNKTLTSPTLTTPNIDSAQFATVSGTAPLYACRAWVNFNGAGALTGTYSQSGTAITVTVTSHGLSQGQSIYITFQTGAASAEAFTVTSVTSANIFVVTSATSQTTSGNCTLATIIRASGNVSSITDNGTGDYTVNFTTAMPDANYTLVATIKPTAAASSTNGKVVNIRYDTNLATSSCRLWCNSTGGAEDMDVVAVAVFR